MICESFLFLLNAINNYLEQFLVNFIFVGQSSFSIDKKKIFISSRRSEKTVWQIF